MVLDYTHPSQGIEAQKVLFAIGISAVLTPYKMLDRGADMATTLLVVHRVEVPPADALRAAEVLDEYGLLVSGSDGRVAPPW